ncbi:hypothetical protein CRYUN_Cryun02cG0053900 [Craigia yunnanensis]
MGRGGGRGGGVFGSSSHPSFHPNSSNRSMEYEKTEHCKNLVGKFEKIVLKCAIWEGKRKGKDNSVCQRYLEELENSCDRSMEYEKTEHCKNLVGKFEKIVLKCAIWEGKRKGKDNSVCQRYLEELENSCGMIF